MRIFHVVRFLIYVLVVITSFNVVNCASEDRIIEGKVATVMEGGLGISLRHYLIAGGVAYDLVFSTSTTVIGMDKQIGDAITFSIKDKSGKEFYTVKIHSDAIYRAKGTISETASRYSKLPIKKLALTYFECVKPGKGENKVEGGFKVKGF